MITTKQQRSRGWGTIFDYRKSPPNKLIGGSWIFDEADHDDVEKFFNMSNEEKWALAHWAEYKSGRRGVITGVFIGVVIMIIVISIFINQ